MDYSFDSIAELEKKYGLPLYIFDEKGFLNNYRNLETEMLTQYPNYRLSYSYKTNYAPYICNLVFRSGGYAEVVSGMEYYIAKKVGYEDKNIILNGPNKEIGFEALLNGAIVNVDNMDELDEYLKEVPKYPQTHFKIGLRVNLNLGQPFVSRFGMDEDDLSTAVKKINECDNISLVGLQCHISRCRGVSDWKKRTEIMLKLADQYFLEAPDYIDLGSGMYGSMEPEFAAQFNDVPTYREYASVTAGLFAEHYKAIAKKPILFTEPGTTLINRFICAIAKIEAIKIIGNKSFAILNCSEHNLGETCTLKQLPLRIISCGNQQNKYPNLDLTGYTCLEQDVLYRNYAKPVSVGDYAMFGNVGGYSNVYKPPFIRPNCAMVAEKENGDICLIKSAETYDDLLNTYVF